MKHLRTILAAALLLVHFAASGEITFKRAPQSSRDTVYNSKYYLVCITDPGNLAAINGEQVKVYKTGTFGRELKLQKGDNPVEVTIFQGTNVETKKFSIYYGERSGGRMDRPAPAPQLQDRLFFVETRENAYLQYGSGTDRLGGSKMGFLDLRNHHQKKTQRQIHGNCRVYWLDSGARIGDFCQRQRRY